MENCSNFHENYVKNKKSSVRHKKKQNKIDFIAIRMVQNVIYINMSNLSIPSNEPFATESEPWFLL